LQFADEDEVIARAAQRPPSFGLAAGRVHQRSDARAHRVIAQLQAGTCWINHYKHHPRSSWPFGGRQDVGSRAARTGRAAIEHYTQLKSVYVALGDIEAPY